MSPDPNCDKKNELAIPLGPSLAGCPNGARLGKALLGCHLDRHRQLQRWLPSILLNMLWNISATTTVAFWDYLLKTSGVQLSMQSKNWPSNVSSTEYLSTISNEQLSLSPSMMPFKTPIEWMSYHNSNQNTKLLAVPTIHSNKSWKVEEKQFLRKPTQTK